MLMLFGAVALQAAVWLPDAGDVADYCRAVTYDGCAGSGDAEAHRIARAAQRQLFVCGARRCRSTSPQLLEWPYRQAAVRRDVAVSVGL
jgi:hypothetical protein